MIKLTPTEAKIVKLKAEGMSRSAIAARLVLSPNTIDSHYYRVCRKIKRYLDDSKNNNYIHGFGWGFYLRNPDLFTVSRYQRRISANNNLKAKTCEYSLGVLADMG